MLESYRVVVDQQLSALFRKTFGEVADARGFSAPLSLGAPDTSVWEYQRGNEIVSMHSYVGEKRLEHLRIASQTSDLSPIIVSVLKTLLASEFSALLEPLADVSSERLSEGIERLFEDLGVDEPGTESEA